MKLRLKRITAQTQQNELYFSGQQSQQQKGKQQLKSRLKVKTVGVKQQSCKKSSKRPPVINNKTKIKLQPTDIRFIERIIEQKHGKILTRQQMLSLKKKMFRQTFTQSNPYTQLNYNTGEANEWKDNMKKTLTSQELLKLKIHFLNIMKMVDRGQQSKYSLKDLSRQFNLDEPAYLQMKRQFSVDPDVSLYVHKSSLKSQPQNQSSQVQHMAKKRYILEKLIQKNSLLTKAELTHKISVMTRNEHFLPQHQVQRLLEEQGLSFRRIVKFPQSRNFKQNLQRKKTFCQKINYLLTQTKYKVYFMGAMNFNSYMFRTEGWTKDEYLLQPMIDESFTLMALTERSGEGTWKFQKQLYKEELFGQTAKTLFENLISESFEPKYVIVDFTLAKYKDVLKKSRKKYDVEIIWLPPFSPLLNPLEFWFQEIKNFLSKSRKMLQLSEQCNIIANKNQVFIKDIYDDLCQIFVKQYNTNFQFTKYFQMAAKNHGKALKMEKF